jgi:hypothetical protein
MLPLCVGWLAKEINTDLGISFAFLEAKLGGPEPMETAGQKDIFDSHSVKTSSQEGSMKRIWTRLLPIVVFGFCALVMIDDASAIGGRRQARRRAAYRGIPVYVYRPVYRLVPVVPTYSYAPSYAPAYTYREYSSPSVSSALTGPRAESAVSPNTFVPSGTLNAGVNAAVRSAPAEELPDPRSGTLIPLQSTPRASPAANFNGNVER